MAVETVTYLYEAETGGYVKSIDAAKNSTNRFGDVASSVGGSVKTLAKETKMFSAAAIVAATASAKTAIDFTKLYETTMIVFEKMLGGKDAANALYGELLTLAKASTYSQEAFLNMGKTFVASGVDAKKTTKYVEGIVNSVAAFGGTQHDLERISVAYTKSLRSQVLSMQDVNVMADSGVRVLEILGNTYGKSTEEIKKMISKGAIPAEKALDDLTKGILEGTDGVNGMTHAMAGMAGSLKGGTLTGALDGIKSAIRSFSLEFIGINPTLRETDEGFEESEKRMQQMIQTFLLLGEIIPKLAPVFKGFTDGLGRLFDKLVGVNPELEESTGLLQRFSQYLDEADPAKLATIGNIIIGFVAIAPVVGILTKILNITGAFVKPITSLAKAMLPAEMAAKGLTSALWGVISPILPIIAGVAAVIAVLAALYMSSEEFREGVNRLIDTMMSGLVTIFETAVLPVLQALWEILVSLKEPLMALWDAIAGFLVPILNVIMVLFEIWIGVLVFFWQAVATVIVWVVNLLDKFGVLKILINTLTVVFNVIGGVVGWFANKFTTLLRVLKDSGPIAAITLTFDKMGQGIQWVIDKVSSLIGWFTSLGSKARAIGDSIGGFLGKISPFRSMSYTPNFGPDPFAIAGTIGQGKGGQESPYGTTNNYTFNVTQSGQLDRSTIMQLKGRVQHI